MARPPLSQISILFEKRTASSPPKPLRSLYTSLKFFPSIRKKEPWTPTFILLMNVAGFSGPMAWVLPLARSSGKIILIFLLSARHSNPERINGISAASPCRISILSASRAPTLT